MARDTLPENTMETCLMRHIFNQSTPSHLVRKKRHDSNSGDPFGSKFRVEASKKKSEVLWLISSESTRQRRGRAGRFARAL